MLKLSDVYFSYRKNEKIVHNVSIEAHEGAITCLLGPSGCGKSTIFKLIAGLEQLHSGQIILHDSILSSKKKYIEIHKRDIAFIFQESCFFPHQNALTNISYAIQGENTQKKAEKILQEIGITHLSKKLPHELSGGQKQLISLARAIAQNAKVILLDEPCSSLDFTNKMKLQKQIMQIIVKLRKIIILITHDPYEAMNMCDYIYVMQNGEIVQSGTNYEIYHYPKTQYVLNFFGEINIIEASIKNKTVNTDFGLLHISKKSLHENQKINVCFRFDVIKIDNQNGKKANIINVKFLGQYYLITFAINNNQYKMFSYIKLSQKNEIKVSLDESNVFYF